MNLANQDNELTKKIEDILEPHYKELHELLHRCPRHSIFWDIVHSAFYTLAIKKSGINSVAELARYLNVGRTTLYEILKRRGFIEWLDDRFNDQPASS